MNPLLFDDVLGHLRVLLWGLAAFAVGVAFAVRRNRHPRVSYLGMGGAACELAAASIHLAFLVTYGTQVLGVVLRSVLNVIDTLLHTGAIVLLAVAALSRRGSGESP